MNILVLVEDRFYKLIPYPTKGEAVRHYRHFKKNGILDPISGTRIPNGTYYLVEII